LATHKNIKEWPHAATKKKRHCDKTAAHMIDIRTPVASVSKSKMVDNAPVIYLSIQSTRSPRTIILTWLSQ